MKEYWVCCGKACTIWSTAAFISTKNHNQKYNYHDFILVQLATCILQMKTQHFIPGFAEMRWFSLGENWNCVLYASEKRQIVRSRWSNKPLSENITGHFSLVSQKGWEEENYLSKLFYFSHISSLFVNTVFHSSLILFKKFGILLKWLIPFFPCQCSLL